MAFKSATCLYMLPACIPGTHYCMYPRDTLLYVCQTWQLLRQFILLLCKSWFFFPQHLRIYTGQWKVSNLLSFKNIPFFTPCQLSSLFSVSHDLAEPACSESPTPPSSPFPLHLNSDALHKMLFNTTLLPHVKLISLEELTVVSHTVYCKRQR